MNSSARDTIFGILSGITRGYLTIEDDDGTVRTFGDPQSNPKGTMLVHDKRMYKRVLAYGSLGLGEAYMKGWWTAEDGDTVSVIGILLLSDMEALVKKSPKTLFSIITHYIRANASRERSRANIQYHYDVGNDFYELFLDENMGYTCAYQKDPNNTIEEMQDQKHELICKKLGLKKGERLIDLGCGFGAMLRYSAKYYGITGAGVTLSNGQVAWGNEKIQREGLEAKIRIDLKDYRDVEGTFDKLVSIGLAEHTWQDKGYSVFMNKIASLLPTGGIGLVHTIGSTAHPHYPTDPWILKYIFPDGRLPRLEELTSAMREAGLTVGHVENLKLHYAETLRHWKEKFHANRDEIKALGKKYDDEFLRMWDYYLQVCEAGFRYSVLQLYQIVFCKGNQWTLPMRFEFENKDAKDSEDAEDTEDMHTIEEATQFNELQE